MSIDNNKKENYDKNGEYIGPFIPGKKRKHPFKDVDISKLENNTVNIKGVHWISADKKIQKEKELEEEEAKKQQKE